MKLMIKKIIGQGLHYLYFNKSLKNVIYDQLCGYLKNSYYVVFGKLNPQRMFYSNYYKDGYDKSVYVKTILVDLSRAYQTLK